MSSSSNGTGHAEQYSDATPQDASECPLYTKAQRWRTYLSEHSMAFARLQEERARGWQSAAMDEWYARRQTTAAPTAAAAPSSVQMHPGTVKDTPQPSAKKASASSADNAGVTSFAHADIIALAERYRQHARRVTQQAAPAFFTAAATTPMKGASSQVSTASPPPLFLDLGCAPGGVSKYLLEDLHWQGVGVTLASTSGGIEVDPILVQAAAHRHNYVLLDGDVTQPAVSWSRSAAYAQVASSSASGAKSGDASASSHADTHRTLAVPSLPSFLTEKLLDVDAPAQLCFHFVNGGAVLDHGQRQRWDQAAAAEQQGKGGEATVAKASPADESKAGADVCSPAAVSPPPFASVLPWFSLLVPQLQAALAYVADGGALMLVHGAPHCASLFILLRCMDEVAGGAAPADTVGASSPVSSTHVHVLETMHLAKPPVYLLWTNVRVGQSSSVVQQRLLQSLSPTAPQVHPLLPPSTDVLSSTVSLSPHALLEAKQRFWLGESDDGFQLAAEGFARYGALVEAIWARVEEFLRRRRVRAEREVAGPAVKHGGRGSKHGPASNKRARSDA